MKQRLLAIVAALTSAGIGAGALVFVQWNEPHVIEHVALDIQGWDLMDADSCSVRACNTAACLAVEDHLIDAGTGCIAQWGACDWRVTPRMRAAAAESGVTLSPKKYQRLEVGLLRCPAADGGVHRTVPLTDAGWPVISDVAEVTPRCVRAPLDGGTNCQRSERDGGFRYFGAGNVMPAVESNGHASCEPVGCVIVFGDNPDTDL
jgi:hypothetical protein